MDQRTPLERAVDRHNAEPMIATVMSARRLALGILAVPIDDPHAALSRIQTLAARIDGIADDAFAASRRAGR